MQIGIILEDDRACSSGWRLPAENVRRNADSMPEAKTFTLRAGSSDNDIEGENVLIVGKQYFLGRRKYYLTSEYGLKAKLTKSFDIIPILRQAIGNERKIYLKNGVPANDTWPVIERIS